MEIYVETVRGDAKFFMVDPIARFTRHERMSLLIADMHRVICDPQDHVVEGIFIGAEIDIFRFLIVIEDGLGFERSICMAIDEGHKTFNEGSLRGEKKGTAVVLMKNLH